MFKKIIVVSLICIVLLVSLVLLNFANSNTQPTEIFGSRIMDITFGVSPKTVISFPYAGVRMGMTHNCIEDDELILQKIEIRGGKHRVLVESVAINKPLNAVGNKIKYLDKVGSEHAKLFKKLKSLTPEEEEKMISLRAEAMSLGKEIDRETFRFKFPGNGIDLRKLKETPLVSGDMIPIIFEVYAMHNGKPIKQTVIKHVKIR